MSVPPTYDLRELGPQAQRMAKDCKNERLALNMQYVALGSMIIMEGAAATHLLKEMFSHTEHHGHTEHRGRSK
jgi:hypothetical protein